MKTIKKIHQALREDIGDLVTYEVLPIANQGMELFEPFILLNHHGSQVFPPHNQGLPFGPHPHRGFETVTFIIKGDLIHKDSNGYESHIKAGGVQWMTAGRGIIHAENTSEEFKDKGGELEVLQLWINLPSKLKMTSPRYIGLQKENIPKILSDHDKVTVNLVTGNWAGTEGAVKPLSELTLTSIHFQKGGKLITDIDPLKRLFFYVVKGTLDVNGRSVEGHQLIEFNQDGKEIVVVAKTEALILLGFATPHNEPIVARGPFVMNTSQEINQALSDFQAGKLGVMK